jgi:hypothetical protein
MRATEWQITEAVITFTAAKWSVPVFLKRGSGTFKGGEEEKMRFRAGNFYFRKKFL